MVRQILITLGLILLPFVVYAIYCLVLSRLSWRDLKRLKSYPYITLLVVGALLVAGFFVFLSTHSGYEKGGIYIPPHMENGVLVPAQTLPPAEGSDEN